MEQLFKIGDLVAFREALGDAKTGRIPVCFIVVELLTQWCSGGQQYHVKVARGGKLDTALEMCLVHWHDPLVDEAIARARNVGLEYLTRETIARTAGFDETWRPRQGKPSENAAETDASAETE